MLAATSWRTDLLEYIDGNWYIALAFNLVFFVGGRILSEASAPRAERRRAAALLGAFAAPSALLLIASLPWSLGIERMPWYNTFRSINRIELAAALIAPFAGFITQPRGAYTRRGQVDPDAEPFDDPPPWPMRILKPLAFPLTLAYVSACFAGPLARPLERSVRYSDVGGARWSDGIMLASGESTSGAAALATALRSLGANVDGERDICVATHASATGAEIWQLARYAAAHGCQWRYVRADGGAGSVSGIPTPAVAQVADPGSGRQGGARRYIALLEASGDIIVVGDPSLGRLSLTNEAFAARYSVISPALALRATP